MANFFAILVLVGTAVCFVACDGNSQRMQLCDSKPDESCARNYFKKNARCNAVNERSSKPVYKENLPLFVPEINITAVTTSIQLEDMVGDIKSLFVNEETGDLVFTVHFDALTCVAPDTIWVFNRECSEPLVFKEYVNVTYPPVTLTAVIPASEEITSKSLENSIYTAFVEGSEASIFFGPKIAKSDNPVIQQVLEKLAATIPLVVKELFRTKAQYYFLAYLQSNICDFDAPLLFNKYEIPVLKAAEGKTTDDESNFEELCSDSDDMLSCLRNYFGKHSSCSVVSQTDDKPVYRKQKVVYVPCLNVTTVVKNSQLNVGNGMTKKFYLDKETKNLVIITEFANIVTNSQDAVLYVSEKGSVPTMASGSISSSYPVIITAVIHIGDGLDAEAIKNAYMSPYFTDTPSITLGSNHKKGDLLSEINSEAQKNLLTVSQEVFVVEAHNFFIAYLQKYICNFDISLSDEHIIY